ncbi:MAG TPA: hypothetical protein VJT71_06555 [Pyrinomonadaceae bacterium]|nr:hypothetical protein [Pyrinomonadaceae bacterium]
MRRKISSTILALLFAVSLVWVGGFRTSAQVSKPGKRAASVQEIDGGWPRGYSLPSEAQIVIFQPQAMTWEGQKHLIAMAAVSYAAKGEQKPVMGTVKFEADTSVALQDRLVKFSPIKITQTNFQTLSKEQTQEIVNQIEKELPVEGRVIALDRVLVQVDKSLITPKNVEGLKSDPPQIFLSRTPAILIGFDGDPIWSPIKDNDLKFAVNTNWDFFQYPPTNTFYLRDDATWVKATALGGPWTPAGKLPDSFKKLPADDDNWKEVVLNLPGKPVTQVPKVNVTTTPSELILIDGAPKYVPVAGTKLLWVSNTESDLFRLGTDGPVYYLVAGRWFEAPNFNGNWQFATPRLPEDFKKISLEHPRSRVLASVPGTEQAAEAVLLAQVPQIARVNRNEVQAPNVTYQGEPSFQPIAGTQLHRAVNTDKDIIKSGESYYLCYQGVWFTSAAPAGPWTLATLIPEEIYQIPASSPAHNVTYVTVEQDDDANDEWVTYAAVAGYTGMMIGWGCAMWGTGWYYPPYYGYGGYYPIYYPYWRTYGYGSWYNPYTGFYGTAGRIYGPYGGAGFGARYNPSTGTYARGAFAYGPYGARGAAQAYNPRTGNYLQTRQGSGVYGSWGSTQVKRGDDWASTKRFTNRQGETTRITRGEQGGMINRRGEGFVGKQGDNIYAGRDGNAYRRDQSGNWSKWENGQWNQAQRPEQLNAARDRMLNDQARQRERLSGNGVTGDRVGDRGNRPTQMDPSTLKNLNRDRNSRREGSQRSRDFKTYQNRSFSRPPNVGGYRGGGFSRGGGGFRGGGGRRR